MKKFKVEKLPLETLIDLFMQLYESGVDYVDLSADNSDPFQDKLIIITKEGYINPKYYKEEGLTNFEKFDEKPKKPKKPSTIETKRLSDDDIDKLL